MLNKLLQLGYKAYIRGIPKIPGIINTLIRLVYSADIPCTTQIADSVYFAHNGLGCVINASSIIGKNVTIYAQVVIGKHKGKSPVIEDDVVIGSGAIILGDVRIGKGAKIGAGSVVMKDVAPNALVTGTLATER